MLHGIPVLARAIACASLLAASAALAQAPAPVQAEPAAAATPGDARQGTFKTVQGEVTRGARRHARSAAVVGDARARRPTAC
jgi:hypothetical protein